MAHSALSGITATDHHAAPAAGPDGPVTVDIAGAPGTAGAFARSGHGHQLATSSANPAALGSAAAPGTSGVAPSRGDHVHLNPVVAHEAAGDPHTGYRLESADHSHASTGLQGGQVAHSALSGVSADQHHARQHSITATADHTFPGGTSTFLRADGTFVAPPGGGGMVTHLHDGAVGEGSTLSPAVANLPGAATKMLWSPGTGAGVWLTKTGGANQVYVGLDASDDTIVRMYSAITGLEGNKFLFDMDYGDLTVARDAAINRAIFIAGYAQSNGGFYVPLGAGQAGQVMGLVKHPDLPAQLLMGIAGASQGPTTASGFVMAGAAAANAGWGGYLGMRKSASNIAHYLQPYNNDLVIYGYDEVLDDYVAAANHPGIVLFDKGTDAATPDAGTGVIYVKNDGLYFRNDAGTVFGPFISNPVPAHEAAADPHPNYLTAAEGNAAYATAAHIHTPTAPKQTILTSNGSWTRTGVPLYVVFEAIGPGGGGGGTPATAANEGAGGTGGGGGAYCKKTVSGANIPTTAVTVTVPVGGNGGAAGANAGLPGGNGSGVNTSIVHAGTSLNMQAGFGSGGQGVGSAGTAGSWSGGAAGTATGGDFNLAGEAGGPLSRVPSTNAVTVATNGGGRSHMGWGAPPAITSGATGIAATAYGYGGGGGGARNGQSSAAAAGGAGAPGVVIITEYYQ